jgi:hypothetical protein
MADTLPELRAAEREVARSGSGCTTRSTRSPACGPSMETPKPSGGCRPRRWSSARGESSSPCASPSWKVPCCATEQGPHLVKEPHEMRPGNRYARHPEARRTLAHLIATKTALVAIRQRCKHRRLLFPAALASQSIGRRFEGGRRAQASPLCWMQPHGHRQGLRVLSVVLESLVTRLLNGSVKRRRAGRPAVRRGPRRSNPLQACRVQDVPPGRAWPLIRR